MANTFQRPSARSIAGAGLECHYLNQVGWTVAKADIAEATAARAATITDHSIYVALLLAASAAALCAAVASRVAISWRRSISPRAVKWSRLSARFLRSSDNSSKVISCGSFGTAIFPYSGGHIARISTYETIGHNRGWAVRSIKE
jgi:hypothetical protein